MSPGGKLTIRFGWGLAGLGWMLYLLIGGEAWTMALGMTIGAALVTVIIPLAEEEDSP